MGKGLVNMDEKRTYSAIFLTSLGYAPFLSWWKRADAISYSQTTWLQTAIGVGYVLLYLRLLLDGRAWFRLCLGFFLASIPIVVRSLVENSLNNRDFKQYNGKR